MTLADKFFKVTLVGTRVDGPEVQADSYETSDNGELRFWATNQGELVIVAIFAAGQWVSVIEVDPPD